MPPSAVIRTAEASLLLTRDDAGATAWTFASSTAPRLACMSGRLRRAVDNTASYSKSWLDDDDAVLDAIGADLESSNFSLLDNFIDGDALSSLRAELLELHAAGRLDAAALAGGARGSGETAYVQSELRGDLIRWLDDDERGLSQLPRYLRKLDALMARLRRRVPSLASIEHRSRAMVACYPGGGARYRRHCDNSCAASRGERCNGRRCTAILYLNDGWTPSHGGELRLFAPFDPGAAEATLAELRAWVEAHRHDAHEPHVAAQLPALRAKLASTSLDDGVPLCDVAPLGGRLVLFYADYRVPHEVLPAYAPRLAVTCWFFDRDERRRALAQGAAEDADAAGAIAVAPDG